MNRSLCVRVPASTSNLGTGFDSLGLALSLFLTVRAEPGRERGGVVLVRGPGTEGWPGGEDDLLVRSLARGLAALGLPPRPLVLTAESEIPLARGLGSSGAAVAAGLLLAAAHSRAPVARDVLLRLGIELEGHPDNIAAALLGGCTLCVPLGRRAPLVLRPSVHPSIAFALAWPDTVVRTEDARAVLPRQVPFADAVENSRRLPLLLEGLASGRPELLAAGGEDRLHVRHRLPLIPGGVEALAAARAAGAWLATISGSGSALLALAAHERAREVAEAMARELRACDGSGHAEVLTAATDAPEVERDTG